MGRTFTLRHAADFAKRVRNGLGIGLLAVFAASTALAGEAGNYAPTRYGLGLSVGNSYTSDGGVAWFLGTAVALLDYDRAVWHRAPEPLRLKLEATAGVATQPQPKAVAAANMLALYYLEGLRMGNAVPYGEAGIGMIFTDFRRPGQGLCLNFNPVAGAGMEFRDADNQALGFVAVRMHHVSNGGLNHHNTGINSVLLTAGVFF
jgi:hypothetical protein